MVFEIILSIALLASFYTIYNLLKKLESYETANEEYDTWITTFNNKIREILLTIKQLEELKND